MLCAEANRIVPAGRLVELLWPDEGPRNPVAALQSQVWRLRRTLAAADLEVERRAPGYLLRVAWHDLDALAFEALVTGTSVADADPAALADLLTAGLAEWRGEPYLGLHDVPALRRESGRLTDLKLSWLERVAERMIEAGASATVLTHLREAVAEAPLRERSRVLLMDALAAEGRTAEAVAQFHAYRRFQAEETGLDPGPAVQAAYRRLIISDEAGGATAPVVRSGSRPLAHTPVPDPLSPIVGREGETDQVIQLFSIGHRLITLTGPGGVGKTRLAVELAHRKWDGVAVFVDLSRVAEPDEVPGAFARAHGVSLATDDPVRDLSAAVGNRELLLVVDNFEQVLPAAGFLSGLLSRCPRVRAVVTSREPLGVPGEVEYPVPPLAVPAPGAPPGEVLTSAAVALFLQRVLDPSIVTGGDRAAAAQVGQLCRELGGLPLAIELAAALARHRSIDEVFGDLMRSLAAPDNGESATGPLEAAIQWSYQRLRPAQQRILRQLCVFRGRFELAAAEAVCGRTELAATLDRLVALGLLTSHRQRTGMRYSVPGIFSEYLRRRETEPAECAAAEAAHLRYHASLCRDPRYLDDLLLTRIHAGYPDYLAALKRGMADVPPGDDVRLANEDEVYDLAIAMILYWLWSDLPQVALPWLDRIADRYAGPPSRLARAHVLRAMFLRNQGRSEEATMLADRAVAALDAAEDWEWLLTCRGVLAASADDRADVDVEEVVRHASAMVQVARAGVPRRLAEALGYLSYAYVAADDGARAAEVAREALSLLDGIDSRSLRASTRVTAAQALIEAGHAVVAREVLASGLRELRDAPDGIPGYHLHLGWACLATGDHADALRWFRLFLHQAAQTDQWRWVTEAVAGCACALLAVGEIRPAALALGAAERQTERFQIRVSPWIRRRLDATYAAIVRQPHGRELVRAGAQLTTDAVIQLVAPATTPAGTPPR